MKLTRRQLFLASLGATQLALLQSSGIGPLSMRQARAGGPRPTKLLTLYVPGGWIPCSLFAPLTKQHMEHPQGLPAPALTGNDPSFYAWEQAVNCDGSGHAEAGNTVQRLRIPQLWDTVALAAGSNDRGIPHPITGKRTVSHGWSWMQHELWKRTCVIHGINQGTAAHNSGLVSALCGAAGGEFRAPAMQAVVANALYDAHADTRPLPAVMVGDAPESPNLSLPDRAAPMRLSGVSALQDTLSRRSDYQWEWFRNTQQRPDSDFTGVAGGSRLTTEIDEQALRRIQGLRGRANDGTDAFLSRLYDGYRGVSRTLARNVVDALDAIPAIDPSIPKPFWLPNPSWDHWGIEVGSGSADSGGIWNDRFSLALKLLRSDLATSVGVRVPGSPGYAFFDTHGVPIGNHFIGLRGCFEVIGRLLGVMSKTPASSGDHWPYTSVALVGAGIEGNRQIGNYDVPNGAVGVPVKITEEDGRHVERPPTSADVCSTIYDVMGVRDHFIPGGFGEIEGVVKA